jgi:hypothetical protein
MIVNGEVCTAGSELCGGVCTLCIRGEEEAKHAADANIAELSTRHSFHVF